MDFGRMIKDKRLELKLTLEDVARAVDVGKATVQRWESGEIKNLRRDRIARLSQVLRIPPSTLVGADDAYSIPIPDSIENVRRLASISVPILGAIHCGEPQYATEDFEGYTEYGNEVQADFALRCRGDSMIGARIYDGDIVFIRQQPDVDDGEIAAVILDDEATLKRVYKLPDGRVQLRAENPRFAPITVGGENDTRQVRILGKAVAFQGDVV